MLKSKAPALAHTPVGHGGLQAGQSLFDCLPISDNRCRNQRKGKAMLSIAVTAAVVIGVVIAALVIMVVIGGSRRK